MRKDILRSFWITGQPGCQLEIQECIEPGIVSVAIHDGTTELRRLWLTKEKFDALCDLRYEVSFRGAAAVSDEQWAAPEGIQEGVGAAS